MARTQNYTLLHDIVLEKKNPETGDIVEEVLREAGATIVLRRPKAKDLKAFDRHDDAEIAAILDMIVSCSGLSTIEADNLDAVDFAELGNVLDPSGRSGPKTGEPS